MTEITWKINTCEHETATGAITTAHWRVFGVDGEYSATAYGSASFAPVAESETFKPYDQITESEVLGWVYAQIDKDAIEASLIAQIDLIKNPVVAKGNPWD